MFPPGSRVLLIGLTKDTTLNMKYAHVVGKFDGRYPVQMEHNNCCLRVQSKNIVADSPKLFVAHVKELTGNLTCFFTLKFEKIRLPQHTAFQSGVSSFELRQDRQLWLYNQTEVAAILRAEEHIGAASVSNVCDIIASSYDRRQQIEKEAIDSLVNCQILRVTCGNDSFIFENRSPCYLMSVPHMLEYKESSAIHATKRNLSDILCFSSRGVDTDSICCSRLAASETPR